MLVRLVTIGDGFCYRVGARGQAGDGNGAVRSCGNNFVYAVAADYKFDAADFAIFRCLNDFQIARLELVVKGNGRCLSVLHLNGLRGFICRVASGDSFGHGISARGQAGHGDRAVTSRGNGFIYAVARDRESDAAHLAVACGLDDLHVAGRRVVAGNREVPGCPHGLNSDNGFLQVLSAIGRDLRAGRYGVLTVGVDGRAGNIRGCADGEGVPGNTQLHVAVRAGDIEVGQHTVGVRKFGAVCAAVVIQILQRGRRVRAVHKAGQLVIACHGRGDLVIHGLDLGVGPVVTDRIDYLVVRTGIGRGGASHANDELPNDHLRGRVLAAIRAGEVGAIALRAAQKRHFDSLSFSRGKAVPNGGGAGGNNGAADKIRARLKAIGRLIVGVDDMSGITPAAYISSVPIERRGVVDSIAG